MKLATKIRKLRALKMSWAKIGKQFGISEFTARRTGDPVWYRNHLDKQNEIRLIERSQVSKALGSRWVEYRVDPADVAARLAEIPDDTRDLTARRCGDPLPGRSALDRRAT